MWVELLVAGAISGSAFFHRGSDSGTSLISMAISTALAGIGPEPRLRKVLDDDAPLGAAAREEEDSPGPPHVAVFTEREASSEGSMGRLRSTI